MMMKLSDYVAHFLVSIGVRDLFLISGGGMMHLLDSVGKHPKLNLICNLNEQASSICADSYGQFTNDLGVCMLTTGPGGTNTVTGITASFLDSTPVLAISGQCKTADFASIRGVRQFGAQEVDIVSIVKPVTKYAVTVTEPEQIRYHLEKAVYLAKHGRKGPVWIDIPLDVQGAQIDSEHLVGFDPAAEGYLVSTPDLSFSICHIFSLLCQAKRPLFLIGGGLVASGARMQFRELAQRTGIPVLATWRAKDVFCDEDSLYFGAPGIPTTRYSNYILQNCDVLIVIGTRLNPALTAYDEAHFAFQAKKVMVDIERNEIKKLNMQWEEEVVCDAADFVSAMLQELDHYELPAYHVWQSFCAAMKQKYPIEQEVQPYDNGGLTDGYMLAARLSARMKALDVFVGSSSGRTCGISHMAISLKPGQRFISSMGLGSMGFTVPSAISCCLASGKQRTIALEGDGSLQHNIQELQLIRTYQLPVKLFILSNGGYASIYMMQKNNFEGRYAACIPDTSLAFPAIRDIAAAYHLDYYCIQSNEQIDSVLDEVMKDDAPVLCEVCSSIYFDEIPKSMTIAHKDGTFSSSKLENLYPFLPEDEVAQNMPHWEDKP